MKDRLRFHLTVVLALACTIQLAAQHFFFENITAQDGLPSSKVYDILEDRDGQIWLGTDGGLAKADGIAIEIFDESDGMAPNGVRVLHQDDQGRIWAGHLGGGLSLIDRTHVQTLRLSRGNVEHDITGIRTLPGGDLLIATYGSGLLLARPKELKNGELPCTAFATNKGLPDRILTMAGMRDGSVMVNAAGQLFRCTADAVERFEMPGLPNVFSITTFFQDDQGAYWCGTLDGGAFWYDPATNKEFKYDISNGLSSNFIMCFGQGRNNEVWAGTWDGGVARITDKGMRIYAKRNGLNGNAVRALRMDREGNMLIGTNENGLNIFKGDRFLSFTQEDGLVDPQVWAGLNDAKGRTWFGTNGGISILDPKVQGTARIRNLTMQQGELTSNKVRSLLEDDRGHIWIGTESGGLFEFDPASFRFKYDLELSGRIPNNTVTALVMGQPGEIWVGTLAGLIRYLPAAGQMNFLGQPEGLAGEHVTALYRDKNGTIWVGSTVHGISRVDNGQAQAVDLGSGFTATCFATDQAGDLWVGTEGRGVLVIRSGKEVRQWNTDHGLLSNNIRSLICDDQGSMWVGTNRGLNQVPPGGEQVFSYTERSGFTGIEAKPNAAWPGEDGHVWVGTSNGATKVDGRTEQDQLVPPVVSVRSLRVNLEERTLTDDIDLAHDERNIRFKYACVSLSDPEAVRYQYRLLGLEKEWQPITAQTEINWPALPPHHYTFEVKAMNRAGLWSGPAQVAFTINPPWWRSWWFYSAAILALAIILFSYIKVRERNLRMRNRILERKVEERTAEVVEQSREIGSQKNRIEELLLNILPKQISEELKEKGHADAKRHEQVTVMFTDMKGFTAVAEQMRPEQLVAELHEHFIKYDQVIVKLGLEKIKTIGDSYMCAGGLPLEDPHHAIRVVLAALEIRELTQAWQERKKRAGEIPWELRIGIHSGPVVAGVVGMRKFAYDIWGDTVNTASRMESSGEPGRINVSGTTWAIVEPYVVGEHRGKVSAKNKGEVDMYFIERLRPTYSSDPQGHYPNARLKEMLGITELAEEVV